VFGGNTGAAVGAGRVGAAVGGWVTATAVGVAGDWVGAGLAVAVAGGWVGTGLAVAVAGGWVGAGLAVAVAGGSACPVGVALGAVGCAGGLLTLALPQALSSHTNNKAGTIKRIILPPINQLKQGFRFHGSGRAHQKAVRASF
jgi:hypothetical protein